MEKRMIFLFTFLMITFSLFAQGIQITGKVSEASTGSPLPGVIVQVKGKATTGTATDSNGHYSITAAQNEELVFSLLGMKTVTVTVTSSSPINVNLVEDAMVLDQVVVIGYGTVKKSSLTGSVSSVSAKDLQVNVARDVASALQGRMPGVAVTNYSGQPGQGLNINVRGLSSLRSNTPLYVIDGVYGDINLIDPSDIASLEVLKDASAAAIYGSRAANGVILISTKSGKRDTPSKVSFNFFTGVQNVAKTIDLMNAEQWVPFIKADRGTVPDVPAYKEGKGTDWQDEIFRSAPIYKANMNISGGSKTATYSASVGYLSQEGIMLNSKYDAFTARLKNDFYFMDNRLKIGESLIFKSSKKVTQNDPWAVLNTLLMLPTVPVYDADRLGGYAPTPSTALNIPNPVGTLEASTPKNDNSDILFNAYADLMIIDGLNYKLNFGYSKNSGRGHNYGNVYDFGSSGKRSDPSLSEGSSFGETWLLEHTLNYTKTFGKHNVGALAGYSAQKGSSRSASYRAKIMPIGGQTINTSKPENRELSSSTLYENSLISYFGRVMYNFDDRYLLSASIRRDGSSKFAKDHRWGSFPSVSVGWNIHNESFAAPIRKYVDQLKLRVSYGKLGNQEIGNYATESAVSGFDTNYVQGTGGDMSFWPGQITNMNWVSPKDLTWETSTTTNVGLDVTLFNRKLDITADYYIQKTEDVLMQVSMPLSGGLGGRPYYNAGTIENKGLELGLTHNNTVDKVTYTIGANIATVNNKVTKVTMGDTEEFDGYNPQENGYVNKMKVGDPIGAFYLIKTDGIFRTQEELNANEYAPKKYIQDGAGLGATRYVDANGDNTIDDKDRQKVGSPFPDFTFGLRASAEWKSFDINMFFDGMVGNKVFNYPRYRLEGFPGAVHNTTTDMLDMWTPNNKNSDIPRFATEGKANTDRWLENGSFIRLKTLEFGYSLPKELLSKAKIDGVRIYGACENLFTITKYKGYTPDLGENASSGTNAGFSSLTRGCDHGRYPVARILSVGIQINL